MSRPLRIRTPKLISSPYSIRSSLAQQRGYCATAKAGEGSHRESGDAESASYTLSTSSP